MANQRSSNRPNILLVLTDQHRYDVAGHAGDPHVHTPQLDALADQSVRFDTALCASPLCTPSRMCLLTGKEAHRCSGWNNHWVLFPEHVTWPGHFASHGYLTALIGKMHFGGRNQMNGFHYRPYGDLRHGLGHQPDPLSMYPGYAGAGSGGVTEVPESLIQDVVVTRETLAFIREHHDAEPARPWFVCASYNRPHPPFTAPGRYLRRYRDKIPPPRAPGDPERLEPYARRRRERTQENEETTQRGREGYYACVDFVDDCIGELLNGLEADGLLENTIVIYTSDHGEMLGDQGLWGKAVYFDPAVRVPLLIRGPGIREGQHAVTAPVSLMDLFPTTCALAGLPAPDGLDGMDFSGVLADPAGAQSPRMIVPSEYFAYGVLVDLGKNPLRLDAPHQAWRMVRDERFAYVEVEQGAALLFDLLNDPGQTENRVGDTEHAERCRTLRDLLYRDFSCEAARANLARDRDRLPDFKSGLMPQSPNQYQLPDGRVFDADGALYAARWLRMPDDTSGGIIPQQFG